MMSAVSGAINNTPALYGLIGVIVASAFTFLGVVVTRADKRSRDDHSIVIGAVQDMAAKVDELADDIRDIKADVRELKASDRTQTERIDSLERPERIRRIH